MTSSDDSPPSPKPDDHEFARTVKLIRCEKHGVSHYANEGCPECNKESGTSPQNSGGSSVK